MNMIKACKYKNEFNDLCIQLEFNINFKKNFTDIICIFLHIELNLINIIAHLSSDKHQKIIQFINNVLTKKLLSYEELQALLNFLSFMMKVVISERIFLR